MELEKEIELHITSSMCWVFDSLNGEPQWIKWRKKDWFCIPNSRLQQLRLTVSQVLKETRRSRKMWSADWRPLCTPTKNKNAIFVTLWKWCNDLSVRTNPLASSLASELANNYASGLSHQRAGRTQVETKLQVWETIYFCNKKNVLKGRK